MCLLEVKHCVKHMKGTIYTNMHFFETRHEQTNCLRLKLLTKDRHSEIPFEINEFHWPYHPSNPYKSLWFISLNSKEFVLDTIGHPVKTTLFSVKMTACLLKMRVKMRVRFKITLYTWNASSSRLPQQDIQKLLRFSSQVSNNTFLIVNLLYCNSSILYSHVTRASPLCKECSVLWTSHLL